MESSSPPRTFNDANARLYYSPSCPFSQRFVEAFDLPPHWMLINLDFRQKDGRGNDLVYIPSINDYHPLPVVVNGSPVLFLPNNGSDNSLRGVKHIQEAFPHYFQEQNLRKTPLHMSPAAAPSDSAHLYQPEGAPRQTRINSKSSPEDSKRQYDSYTSLQQELWTQQSRMQQGHALLPQTNTNNHMSSSISGSYEDLQQPSRSRTRGIALSGFR